MSLKPRNHEADTNSSWSWAVGAFSTLDGSTGLRLKVRLWSAAVLPPTRQKIFIPLNFNQLCFIFCLQKVQK